VVWARAYPAHHDLDVPAEDEIWVLTRQPRIVPELDPAHPILEDFVSVLDAADGRELRRLSILEAYEASAPEHSWRDAATRFWELETARKLADDSWRRSDGPRHSPDLFHTNSLRVLDGRLAAEVPAFRQGNLLLSMCHLDTIAVLDPRRGRIVWSMTGPFGLQHDPTLTRQGNVLLFNNHLGAERSSVVAFDPVSGEPAWHYGDDPDEAFYSRTCGAARELPNDNVLVTVSDRGHAFELTPEGDVVWDFRSPHRAGADGTLVATLFEMTRLPADFPTDFIPPAP
jgi:outer membrane protein assembly factor BamB